MRANHFCFKDGIEIVYGASRAAVYDLDSGRVFSVDEDGAAVLRALENSIPVGEIPAHTHVAPEVLTDFLARMTIAGTGKFWRKSQVRHNPDWHQPPPRTLDLMWVEVTNRCNLRCVHCYAEGDRTRETADRELDVDTWKRILHDAAGIGCAHVTYIGGEPLLRPDLVLALADYARKNLGIKGQEVFTNGTLLTDDLASRLVSKGVGIAVSIYSVNTAIHDQITRVPMSLEKSLHCVENVVKIGGNVRVAVVALRNNASEFNSTANELRKRYPTVPVKVDIVRPAGGGVATEVLTPELKAKCHQTVPSFTRVWRDAFWRRHHGHSCLWGKIAVGPSGDVYPCIMLRNPTYGNVAEQSLANILAGSVARESWEQSKDKVAGCADCEYRYACFDCRLRSAWFTGEVDTKPALCHYDPCAGAWSGGHGASPPAKKD